MKKKNSTAVKILEFLNETGILNIVGANDAQQMQQSNTGTKTKEEKNIVRQLPFANIFFEDEVIKEHCGNCKIKK